MLYAMKVEENRLTIYLKNQFTFFEYCLEVRIIFVLTPQTDVHVDIW